MNVADLQTRLKTLNLYSGVVDDRFGPKTDDAVEALLLNQAVVGRDSWSDARQRTAAMQVICRMDGIETGQIDGLIGTQTRFALEVWDARKKNGGRPVAEVEEWRDKPEAQVPVAPSHALPVPPVSSGISLPSRKPAWPRQSGMTAFYGAPGTNQVQMTFPFQMRLAWELSSKLTKTSCNRKCKESFERLWSNTLAHYGIDEIRRLRLDLFGGLLNVRKMRGGSAWSMHSWGVAQDVDPERNQLKWKRAQATLDNPPYDAFWSFVYAEGMISLGRERDYDWMHLQAALL